MILPYDIIKKLTYYHVNADTKMDIVTIVYTKSFFYFIKFDEKVEFKFNKVLKKDENGNEYIDRSNDCYELLEQLHTCVKMDFIYNSQKEQQKIAESKEPKNNKEPVKNKIGFT